MQIIANHESHGGENNHKQFGTAEKNKQISDGSQLSGWFKKTENIRPEGSGWARLDPFTSGTDTGSLLSHGSE